MDKDLHIRGARPADAPALSALALRAKAHWGYPDDWLQAWRRDLTFTADYLRAHACLVAVRSGTLLGICALEIHGDHGSIEHLWVDPECHRQGVGRALVATVLQQAVQAGISRIEVISDPFAEPFYLRLGARRAGAVPAPMPRAADRVLPLLEFTLARSSS